MLKKHYKIIVVLLMFITVSTITNYREVIVMANKYCNLDGTQKISEEYPKITNGFGLVETDVNTVDDRVTTIITTPLDGIGATQEIIDARQGEISLGENITGIKTQLAEIATNVRTLGAVGDGVTDDTSSIQLAIDNGTTVLFPQGIYKISGMLTLHSNLILKMENCKIVQSIKGHTFFGSNIKNVEIIGHNFEMESSIFDVNAVDTSLYGGHMVYIGKESENISIKGITVNNSTGDCISISNIDTVLSGDNKNIRIEDCILNHPYRIGLSITSCDGALIKNCEFNYANHLVVKWGVDLEPNANYHVKNIKFKDCKARYNSSGFGGSNYETNIVFENCLAELNIDMGFYLEGATFPINDVTLINCRSINNSQISIYGLGIQKLTLINCECINEITPASYIMQVSTVKEINIKNSILSSTLSVNGLYLTFDTNSIFNIENSIVKADKVAIYTNLEKAIIKNNTLENITGTHIMENRNGRYNVSDNIFISGVLTSGTFNMYTMSSSNTPKIILLNNDFEGGAFGGSFYIAAGEIINGGNITKSGVYSTTTTS